MNLYYEDEFVGSVARACKHAFKNDKCPLRYTSLDPLNEYTLATLIENGYSVKTIDMVPATLETRQAMARSRREEAYWVAGTGKMFENWHYDAAVAGDNDDQTLQASLDSKAQASRKTWIDTVAQVKEQIPIPTI